MQAYSPSGSSNPMVDNNIRVGNEIDEKIGSYSKLLDIVSDSERPCLRSKLLSARLMKEKLVAMTALAKAQNIIAEMDVLVAENNLKTALEQLDKYKEEHTEPAENKKSSLKPELKRNTLKELEKPASTETSNSRHQRVASLDADKESGKNMATERQKASSHAEAPKVQKAPSATPSTERRNKRSHSNSSSSTSHKKKAKKTKHVRTTAECQSTLTGASPSNSKSTPHNNKGVQTCNECFQSNSDTESLKKARKTVDEETALTSDVSKGSKSHRDAVNVSKALQKILTPKTAQTPKPAAIIRDCIPDLTKSPGEYRKQLLFEDEPRTEATKSKVKVKTEAVENGDVVLIL